jgi:anti-sigma factor ChrR (cupin superfamily)
MKMIRVGSVCAGLIGLAVIATGVHSQEKKEGAAAAPVKIMHFGDLKWTPIIKGCDLAAVAGDPNAEGTPYVVRLRCVDGAKIPAHWHPTDENVTVMKGTFLAGMGETFDETKLATMNVGNFVTMPKEMVHGAGPFKVNWVNPSEVQPPDAPAAAAAKPKS